MEFYIGNPSEEIKLLEESNIFTKIVIKDGYHQIPINPKDIKKTAFTTEIGKFEFNVMPYNLKNNDKTFLKIIQKVVGYNENIKFDSNQILISDQDQTDHLKQLKKVFNKLEEANFKIDLKQSCFGVDKVSFAGFQISKDGFTIDPDVAEKIR